MIPGALYKLNDRQAEYKLRNDLMGNVFGKDNGLCVLGPSNMEFPVVVDVSINYKDATATLKPMLLHDGIWRYADTPLRLLVKPTNKEEVVLIQV